MREIKFRAWDKKEKYMITNSTRCISFHGAVDGGNCFYELMQYTGLLDKNGVEIYEGDIIQWVNENDEEFNHEIIFKDGGWNAKSSNGNISQIGGTLNSDINIYIEVIGNIYENGNLL